MIQWTAQQVAKEMKAHPFTLIAVLGLTTFSVWANMTFARAEDVRSNGEKIDRILLLQYAEAIRGQHRQICSTEDRLLRATLLSTLDNLQAEYQKINGSRYPLEDCLTES